MLGGSAAAAAVAVSLFLPVRFPRPGGDLRVGTTTRHWADRSRAEILAVDDGDEPRELAVQIWYPTGDADGVRSRYLPDAPVVFASLLQALREVTSGRTSLPSFLFRKLAASRTHALVDATPTATAFPVIVAASGFGGFRTANTILTEELVSQGHVVVGMDQPHVSARTRRADGRIVTMTPRERLYAAHSRERVVAHLAADVSFVIDMVAEDPHLRGCVDVSRVGVMGVSLGGTVAAAAASLDDRIAACLMMDAVMPAGVASGGLPCHALWLTRPEEDMRRERRHAGGWPEPVIAETLRSMTDALAQQRPGTTGRLVSIPGMYHIDFTDAPHWFPWARWVGLSGRIGARRAHRVIARAATPFFRSALRGRQETPPRR